MHPYHPARSVRRKARVSALVFSLIAFLITAAGLVYAAAPPANSQIANQATATYIDAGNTARSVTSNTVVTTVQQVASFTLTTDGQAKFAAPGAQVVYPHTLTNTGNGADTFNLSVVNTASGSTTSLSNLAIYPDATGSGVPSSNTPITSTGALPAGGVFKFVVAGTVPGSATSAQTAVVTLTASGTATATPATAQTNTDTTTVTNNAVVSVTKSINSSSGAAGTGPYTYTLTYTNTGNATATGLTLTDAIPAGVTYVAGSGRWSVTGAATTLTDASNTDAQGTTPNIIYDFGVTAAGKVTAVISAVAPGESRTLTFQVTVPAGQATGTIPNTAQYSYNDGTNPVPANNTNTVNFTVTQTAAVSVGNNTVPTAPQGATVSFTNPVTNNGNGTDTFDLTVANTSFPAGTTFQLFKSDGATPLTDTNSTSTPDTGPLAPGGVYNVVVKATLPPGAVGTNVNYALTLTATSGISSAVTATGTDTLTTISPNTVDLTNNAALPGGLGQGAGPEATAVVTNTANPGTVSQFVLYVNNTSGQSDTFNLSYGSDATATAALPAGWSVVFRDSSNAVQTNTGVVTASGNKMFTAYVTVPAGAAPGPQNVYFKATSPTTSTADLIHDAATVNTVRAIAITPNNSGQVTPAGSVVYSHTLTNNGNVTEGDNVASTIALTTGNSLPGWSSVIYYDAAGTGVLVPSDPVVTDTSFVSNGAAGLAPGESVKLLLKVLAPAGAAQGAIDSSTLTATDTNGTLTTTAPPAVTSTDSTQVVADNLVIVKKQALDANNDGVPDTAYSINPIGAGALPGKSIRYQITVTNNGTTAASSVQIKDSTPTYTTYTATGPAAVTGGSAPAVNSVPADGAAGPLIFNVGTMNPGDVATATFGVKINP